ELLEGVGVEQNLHHIYTVWEHNTRALEYTVSKKYSLAVRLAALLHDVCEDTECAPETLEKNFGKDISFLVDGVTKLDKIRFHGTEREAENLRKMFLAIAEDIRVVLIKLMDRLHNIKTLNSLSPEKQKRIALETLELYAPLAYRLGIGEVKGQLEDLSFPYVYPKEYEWLMQQVKDPLIERQKYAEWLIPLVKRELEAENLTYRDVHGRAKHLFSLYKKLLKYEMDINKIFDLVAVRIVVGTIEECYGALGVVHKLWRPMPGLVKDYIALPKPNGYRSIHTTVFGPKGRVTEFQIRTEEMHIQAEQGIAAHWAYSEGKSENAYRERQTVFANKKQLEWVNQLRDWQKEFRNPDEFVESLKIDFFKNRIFVLTPKGDVIDLPENSTPVDFAYHVHTDIGNQAAGARVNAKMASLDYELHNGDIIEIIIQKNKKPSRDWLLFVKTAAARKRIQSALRETREAASFSQKGGQMVELRLSVKDRIGLIKDVSAVVADFKINMKSITSETKNRLYPLIVIHASLKNKEQLEKLMIKFKGVNGV
ncbi:MAG: bifunctional (p)ppGpp synthetase/guanosine-3',5'-bis(diphosphate) 3'-pyrophosphohydrolase, partial [Candidatus Sungbacteria bacterium]|nr:bifunctional (p)ppGpp synthetase/guanosine-3',5'-bis(diphosphate) 3'-pyrophosphohydrolase [Candidatus Sungbacteria bacterium]